MLGREDLFRDIVELDGTNSTAGLVARLCHVCHATISADRTFCTSCGHPLCKTCICPVPEGAEEAHRVFVASGGAHLTVHDGDTLTSYNRSIPPSPTKEAADPLEVAEARPGGQYSTTQDTGRDETRRRTAAGTTSFSRPLAPRKSRRSVHRDHQVTLEPSPANSPVLRHSRASKRQVAPSDCISHRSDSEYGADPCSDPACRATHPGYRPYRHSLACTKRRMTLSGAEERTNCDTSCSDEFGLNPPLSYHGGRQSARTEQYGPADTSDQARRRTLQPRYHGQGPGYHSYDQSRDLPSGPPTVHYDQNPSHGSPRCHQGRRATVRDSRHRDSYPEEHQTGSDQGKSSRHHNPNDRPCGAHDYAQQPGEHGKGAVHDLYHYYPHTHSSRAQETLDSEAADESQSRPEQQTRQDSVEPQQEPATTRERLSSLQTKSAPSLQTVAAQSPTEDKAKDFREVRLRLRPTSTTPRQSKTATELQEQNEESFREARKNLIHYSPAPDEQNTKLPHDNSQRTSTSNAHPLQAQATLEAELSSVNAETASPLAGPSSVDKGKAREELRRQSRQSVGQSTNKVPDEHNCGWKQKYDELQRKAGSQNTPDDIGLESLTIVLHMKGRDDLVINTDLRKVT